MKAIVKEYVQGLHNQKLPHDQGKTFLTQKLCKLVVQQRMIAKAAMDTNNNKARTKCIEGNRIDKAWQQHRGKQTQNATCSYKQCALCFAQRILLVGDDAGDESDYKRQMSIESRKISCKHPKGETSCIPVKNEVKKTIFNISKNV